ncbi:unnamed protein product [Phytophthora lilii]|uniref:Unnamed protein product n=1 Tax=Phytophthora lilii TaxID=2077276 RepID=A0A9W6WQJ7_9STRA|nr:unnamed protein product [Phytophthora lilii]
MYPPKFAATLYTMGPRADSVTPESVLRRYTVWAPEPKVKLTAFDTVRGVEGVVVPNPTRPDDVIVT